MKKLLILITVLAAGIVMFFLLNNPLGRLMKLAIEEFGPKITQSEVRVSNVKISATDGQGVISGLLLGNPKGFKTEYALKAEKIEIAIDPASMAQYLVMINNVLVDGPHIIYEKGDHGTNFDAILRNIEQYIGEAGNKHNGKGTSTKMIINKLIIRNAKVSLNGTIDVSLPNIELHNIGRKSGGATAAEVVKAIIGELLEQMALAIPRMAAGSVKSAVKNLFSK